MNKLLTYFIDKFKFESHQIQAVIEPEELKAFYLRILGLSSHSNKNISSKDHLIGDMTTEYNGQGMDYSESRLYAAGDDTRFINWKQTAKAGELISNKYYQEAENIDYVLLDARACMYYGTQVQTKLSTAIKVSMIASIKSINANKKLKVITICNKISISGIIDSKEKLLNIFLAKSQKSDIDTECKPLNLSTSFKYIQSLLPFNSSINIISDFHDLNGSDLKILKSLNSHNNISLYKISDPIESKLPPLFPLHYQSLSSEQSITISNSNELKSLNNAIEEANSKLSKFLYGTGCLINEISNLLTDEDLLKECTR